MAKQITFKIKKSDICKIGIYDNHTTKYTMANVYTNLQKQYPGKEVYLINAGFFNMKDLTPCFELKADGKELSANINMCYMGMKGKNITFCKPGTATSAYTDCVSAYPALIENGVKSSYYTTKNMDNTNRGRSAVGYTANEVILTAISDVSGSSDYTLDEELLYMQRLGCEAAINLDGGGSTQIKGPKDSITSTRKVSNFIYVIANVDMSKTEYKVQKYLNDAYNAKLVVDGLLGPASKTAIIKAAQTEFGLKGKDVDGSWGPKSKAAVKFIGLKSKNNTTARTKMLQCALCRCGYWYNDINGKYDTELDTALKQFQRAKGLTVDGCAGTATFTALFK